MPYGSKLPIKEQHILQKEIVLPIEETKDKNSLLSNEEKKLYRSAVCQLNWVAGISRPGIRFPVCEGSTKFKNATIKYVLYVNKTIKNEKTTNYIIKFAHSVWTI